MNLDWQLEFGGQTISGIWTANGSSETYTICPLPGQGFPVGELNLSFLELNDGICVCQ